MKPSYELKSLIYGKYNNQSELSRHLGWSKQRLSRIVTGQKMPDVEELNELSAALDEPVENMIHIFLREKSPNGQHSAKL